MTNSASIGAKFWNLKKTWGSITKPFFNYFLLCSEYSSFLLCSEYSSETYIAYNAEHYERIRNILPIVYSRNYDPKRCVKILSTPDLGGEGAAPP